MHETILVTGATGTVGNEVIEALSSQNVRVRAGVHSIIKGDRFRVFPNVDLVEIDYARPESLRVAYTGVTRVFQITPFTQDQVEIAKRLIDMAKEVGVKQIVKLSASGADAEPGIQMGRWHREAEQYLESSGVPYTILRPTSFMQNFIAYQGASIVHEGKIYQPLGSGKVSYIDAHDIAAVAKVVLTQSNFDGEALELTGPEAISVEEVAGILSRVSGRTITYVDVPEEAARQAMSSQHLPDWMVDAMLELNQILKAGYGAHVTNTVAQITGRPARTFAEFAQNNAHCFIAE
ncbi:SDR family oxidoreductase [Adhaeribacter pallidiroseus]|uniref:NADH:ubiquinone reductase (H(+)-translocating) n=1 Tax=Adhaeribacter pallidiroseus TaxID=2072847 RepID=A0A369QVC0_9BACT|nr:SDR family oxidoreductase [Adhaeribacter pallidiroseus]RDC66128.1 NADH:ubiquinone reductase (H(+)-translocating) [Adhaeribacter pallidiroseus]